MSSEDGQALQAADAPRAQDPDKDALICPDEKAFQSSVIDYGRLATLIVLLVIGGIFALLTFLLG